jgi:hypothetical protein
MKKQLATLVVLSAIGGAAFAQGGALAQAPASADPVVQMRMAEREANAKYAAALLQAYAERQSKVSAAVEAAVKDADAKGKDPLVAKRDAHAKAVKATEKDYEAKLASLKAEHKAATAAAKKKGAAKG